MPLLLENDQSKSAAYASVVQGGFTRVGSWPQLAEVLTQRPDEVLVVIGADVPMDDALTFATDQRATRPALGIVLLRRQIDVDVLGAALRAGVREVVSPDDVNAIAEACSRSTEVSRGVFGWRPHEAKGQGRVVTVFAAKGGCGKTTMATNLAVILAAGGKRSVCLLDLDISFGDVAITMQLFPTKSLADAVPMRGTLDREGVRSLVTPHSPGLDTLLAPLDPGEAERIPTALVSEVLHELRQSYDFVVVDTPPDFKDCVLAALDVSDVYVLLATLDVPSLKNLRLTLDMLDLLGYRRDNWQIVLNRADSKVGLNATDVEKTLKVPIAARVPSSGAVSTSINKGVPLTLVQPNHPFSCALRAFVDEKILPRRAAGAATGAEHSGSTADEPAPRRRFRRRKVATT
jgi:pilus assembly protein CpaE